MTQEIQDEICGLLHEHYVSPPHYIYIYGSGDHLTNGLTGRGGSPIMTSDW